MESPAAPLDLALGYLDRSYSRPLKYCRLISHKEADRVGQYVTVKH